MSRGAIVRRYTAIATVASLANLALQRLWMDVYSGPLAVETATMLATALVLPAKYLADKHFIFGFRTGSGIEDVQKLAQYAAASVVTVAVFWTLEFSAHRAFRTPAAQYLGGAAGLALSFWLKYHIDKRFVFR
jgi:hypothetical protein